MPGDQVLDQLREVTLRRALVHGARPPAPTLTRSAGNPQRRAARPPGTRQAGRVERPSPDDTIRRADSIDAPAVARVWSRSRMAAIPAIPAPVHGADDVLSWFASEVIPKGGTWVMDQGGLLVGLL